jgi:hypothetical protein
MSPDVMDVRIGRRVPDGPYAGSVDESGAVLRESR